MRFPSITLVVLAAIGFVDAQGSMSSWHPAGSGDSRGPCPMLNTLANHEYLPHNGRDFTLEQVKYALKTALNFTDEFGKFLNDFALTTNPDKNASTWGLDTLSNHNILEHDASLSRADNAFGNDSTSFNQTVFDRTRAFWTAPWINVQMAANARLARMLDSVKFNPQFALSELAGQFSAGEGAAYLMVFGDRENKTARRDQVEFLFENERLPTDLGWKTPTIEIGTDTLFEYSELIFNATNYQAEEMMTPWERRNIMVRKET